MIKALTIIFDVTGLSDDEISGLEFEAAVQAESSERHPDVDVVKSHVSYIDAEAT